MAKEVTPREIAQFCRIVAAGIDASKSPRPDLVASDVRCAIAAMGGDEGAIERIHNVIAAATKPAAAPAPAPAPVADPIALNFSGQLSGDLMQRAAAELEKRRPGLKGKKLQFLLSAKVSE